MTAREIFRVGDLVELTESGESLSRVLKQGQRGIVCGFGHKGNQVRVRSEGKQFIRLWHMRAWQKVK